MIDGLTSARRRLFPEMTGNCALGQTSYFLLVISGDVGGRFALPRIGPVLPQVRATFGYEWFRSELTDNGVTSGRNYRGPILASVQALANFGSKDRGLGPFVGMSGGMFSDRVLETPAFTSASSVDRAGLHIWLELGVRGAVSF